MFEIITEISFELNHYLSNIRRDMVPSHTVHNDILPYILTETNK